MSEDVDWKAKAEALERRLAYVCLVAEALAIAVEVSLETMEGLGLAEGNERTVALMRHGVEAWRKNIETAL